MGKTKKDSKHDAHAGAHHNTNPHELPHGHHDTSKGKKKHKPKEGKKTNQRKK